MRNTAFLIALFLFAGCALPAEQGLKSSLQPGEAIPGAFSPLNVTGMHAGEPHCLVCENGLNPVAMIFAREPSDSLNNLLAALDAECVKHQKSELGSFVVYLSEKQDLEKQLRDAAKKAPLKHVVLSIAAPAGPEDYKVNKDADITVVLYVKHSVKANHTFKKGELNDKAIEKIVADLPKILPQK